MPPGRRFATSDVRVVDPMLELLIRVVIDTNVWISAFINPLGPPARLIERAQQGEFALVLSDYLIDEIREVCQRERIRRRLRINPGDIDTLLERFRIESITVETAGTLRLCRDPDDDRILETAVTGRVHYLISRDDDLKRDPDLIEHLVTRGVRIVSVARFLELLDIGQV